MKKFFIGSLFLLLGSLLFAQVAADPFDNFYDQVERWENLGIIEEQPPLRPYSVDKVKQILADVIESDNPEEAEIASMTYERLFYRSYKFKLEGEIRATMGEDKDKQAVGIIGLDGDLSFPKWVSMAYKLNILGAVNSTSSALPLYSAQPYYFRDGVDIGPIDAYLESDGTIAVGNDHLYGQAGINHASFGHFYDDSVVLSPNAKHTANFSFVYAPGRWNYSQALLVLSASNTKSSPLSYKNNDLYSNKFMALHSINGTIFPWLSASFYEVVVYGNRFDPSYLIPMPFMVTQGITGYDDDNVFMGITFSVKPVKGLVWTNDFFVDDVNASALVKMNFDTKIRGAFQTGIKFTPDNLGWLKFVKLNYTLVTPYMYAHRQNTRDSKTGNYTTVGPYGINYQEYTTAGLPLGSSLEPNSDRVQLNVNFRVNKGLSFGLRGTFIRHANVNESLTEEEILNYMNYSEGDYLSTDGSIHNHTNQFKNLEQATKKESDYLDSAWNRFMFMNQNTKMYVVQLGLDVTRDLPRAYYGQLSITFGYTFEYMHNFGVSRNLFSGTGKWNADGTFTPGTNTREDIQLAIARWQANLKDVAKNYAYVTFKYTF